jgi:hypothetical protein
MHTNIRLNLINNVASIAYHGHYNKLELLWLIGMLSDVTISDDMLIPEIEKVKKEFPEFIEMLTFKEK